MFLPIVVGKLPPLVTEVLLHQWINHDLLSDGVSGNLPCQLASPPGLRIDVSAFMRTFVLVMILVHLYSIKATDSEAENTLEKTVAHLLVIFLDSLE